MTPDACSECGSTIWVASVVDDRGVRTCAACLVGVTALPACRPVLRSGGPFEHEHTAAPVTAVRKRRR